MGFKISTEEDLSFALTIHLESETSIPKKSIYLNLTLQKIKREGATNADSMYSAFHQQQIDDLKTLKLPPASIKAVLKYAKQEGEEVQPFRVYISNYPQRFDGKYTLYMAPNYMDSKIENSIYKSILVKISESKVISQALHLDKTSSPIFLTCAYNNEDQSYKDEKIGHYKLKRFTPETNQESFEKSYSIEFIKEDKATDINLRFHIAQGSNTDERIVLAEYLPNKYKPQDILAKYTDLLKKHNFSDLVASKIYLKETSSIQPMTEYHKENKFLISTEKLREAPYYHCSDLCSSLVSALEQDNFTLYSPTDSHYWNDPKILTKRDSNLSFFDKLRIKLNELTIARGIFGIISVLLEMVLLLSYDMPFRSISVSFYNLFVKKDYRARHILGFALPLLLVTAAVILISLIPVVREFAFITLASKLGFTALGSVIGLSSSLIGYMTTVFSGLMLGGFLKSTCTKIANFLIYRDMNHDKDRLVKKSFIDLFQGTQNKAKMNHMVEYLRQKRKQWSGFFTGSQYLLTPSFKKKKYENVMAQLEDGKTNYLFAFFEEKRDQKRKKITDIIKGYSNITDFTKCATKIIDSYTHILISQISKHNPQMNQSLDEKIKTLPYVYSKNYDREHTPLIKITNELKKFERNFIPDKECMTDIKNIARTAGKSEKQVEADIKEIARRTLYYRHFTSRFFNECPTPDPFCSFLEVRSEADNLKPMV